MSIWREYIEKLLNTDEQNRIEDFEDFEQENVEIPMEEDVTEFTKETTALNELMNAKEWVSNSYNYAKFKSALTSHLTDLPDIQKPQNSFTRQINVSSSLSINNQEFSITTSCGEFS